MKISIWTPLLLCFSALTNNCYGSENRPLTPASHPTTTDFDFVTKHYCATPQTGHLLEEMLGITPLTEITNHPHFFNKKTDSQQEKISWQERCLFNSHLCYPPMEKRYTDPCIKKHVTFKESDPELQLLSLVDRKRYEEVIIRKAIDRIIQEDKAKDLLSRLS